MDTRRRWIGYDWFKLIVALVLLVLLLFLLLQRPAGTSIPRANQGNEVGVVAATQTPPSPTDTVVLPTATLASPPSFTPTTVMPTATLPPEPTATLLAPTPTSTAQPAPTETPLTTPGETPQPEPTEAPQPQAAAGDCPLAQPSRLAVENQAVVLSNLNMRREAGMDKQIIRVSLPNSKVEIIGGPVCIPYQNGAYQWWNVKSADGVTGWSAEASLSKNFYFLQPVP